MAEEYIGREKIVKLANEIKDNFAPLHRLVIDAFIYCIETNISTTDVVEVVRCKDCKYNGKISENEEDYYCQNKHGLNGYICDASYCCNGKKKEGVEE